MRALAPWMDFKHEMDRLFDRFPMGRLEFGPKWDEFPALGEWAPSLDLSETKEALVVKLEVPGMDPADIQISLQENLLTVKGEKKQEKEEKDERYHRVERAYGAFTRTVRLPVAVDSSKVVAAFKNGLLTVTLPKTPAAKGTTIPIKAG
jgi:HSP20 family protein